MSELVDSAATGRPSARHHPNLRAITGWIGQRIDRLIPDELIREGGEMLDVIHGSAMSLLALVDDILDYAQLESGSLRLTDAPFSLRELVDGTLSMMVPMADAKGLRLISEIEPTVPSCLVGDGSRIRQILVNLIGNAIKFTDEGHVKLRIEAESDGSRATLKIQVEDTGPGISEAEHDRVFDRFGRLDSSSSRIHPESGLGLSICRGLLELVGGSIKLESQVGTGSCFQVMLNLPLANDAQSGACPPSALCLT